MSDTDRPPVSGLVAGKYEVVRLIGRGGMGSVWEGRHVSLGTRVAIKFIDKQHAESEEARSRFVNEARAAATIETKHAIRIFDHGMTEEGRPYIVMEMLVGEALDTRIERLGQISLQETARVLAQVCRALQRAHFAGIIHRDLKPENIFLVHASDDDDETAKVLDFGIAKIMGPPGTGLTSSTKTGAVLGTPCYMSPEQARGLKNLDYRSDLWSLGVIAYRCVTGRLPFEGESVGDLLVKICTSPPPLPSSTVPELPSSFDAWFFRALAREPADRFASASELGEALAMTAGVSVRRGPASGSLLRSIDPMVAAPSATPQPSSPGVTSAGGLAASPVPAKASRGRLFVALAAVLVGASIGAAAVVKLAAPTRAAGSPGEGAPANTTTTTTATTTATPTAASTLVALSSSSSPSPPPRLAPRPIAAPAKTATIPAPAHAAKAPPASADPGY
jgi:serine/threonine protein kinase